MHPIPPVRPFEESAGPVHQLPQDTTPVDFFSLFWEPPRSGKKWWRFICWYLLDVSISNACIVEGLSSHVPSSRSRHTHLQFRLELAKQLIGGYSGRKRYAGKKRKATPFDNALSLPNLPSHREVKLEGRKGACMNCSLHGHRNPSGKQCMAAIAVVYICVVRVVFWSFTQKMHMYKHF